MLSQFWQAQNVTEAEMVIETEGYLDVLENVSHSEFRAAWADYQINGPRTAAGKLIKPDAGAIYNIAIANRRSNIAVVSDDEKVLNGFADMILKGVNYAASAVSPAVAARLIDQGRVTPDQCRAAGVNV